MSETLKRSKIVYRFEYFVRKTEEIERNSNFINSNKG